MVRLVHPESVVNWFKLIFHLMMLTFRYEPPMILLVDPDEERDQEEDDSYKCDERDDDNECDAERNLPSWRRNTYSTAAGIFSKHERALKV